MEYKKFKKKISEANLSVKKFCEITGVSVSTTNNWSSATVPSWVESWLDLYLENQKMNKLRELAKEICEGNKVS